MSDPRLKCVDCGEVIVYRPGDPVAHVGCQIAEASVDPGARDALWVAIEEVDNCWTDVGDHIEWDEDELPDRLIELRRAYAAAVYEAIA